MIALQTAATLSLLSILTVGCVETRSVTVDLYEPADIGLRSGFQCTCSEYAPGERQRLIANAAEVAIVLEVITWSTPGLPSCRAPDLQPHCQRDDVDCQVFASSPRICMNFTLNDGGVPDNEVLRFRTDALNTAVRGLTLPPVTEPAGVIRVVVVAGRCSSLGFDDDSGLYLLPDDPERAIEYPRDSLVACANSCPTLFAESDDPVRLGLSVGECNEATLRACAANPLVFDGPQEQGDCRLPGT